MVRKVVGEEDSSEFAVSGLWLQFFGYRCGLWVCLIDSRNRGLDQAPYTAKAFHFAE